MLKVERRIDLVYGGGSVGLMGLVSQAVHDGGRHVLGLVSSLILYQILNTICCTLMFLCLSLSLLVYNLSILKIETIIPALMHWIPSELRTP